MSFIFDYSRRDRIGLPESIYCAGKDLRTLDKLLGQIRHKKVHPVLLTRLSKIKYEALSRIYPKALDYDGRSHTAFFNGTLPRVPARSLAIVTAGTSDLSVALEAARTADYLGISNKLYSDVGVAGLWRLRRKIRRINRHDVVIAVAGMDAALVSVLGGLTPKPVIAVPTSVGYGAARKGLTAFYAALTSCAPGILVTNVDNGYGAACAAYRIVRNQPAERRPKGRR